MSVSKWAYTPEMCDGEICVGDCDLCDKPKIMPEFKKCNSDGKKMVEKCDYISRQAAIDFIDTGHLRQPTELSWSDHDVKQFLEKQPTADVRENVRGEWIYIPIENGMVVAMCPICKKCSAITQSVKKWYRFCPNCGADMRGE